MFLKINDSMMEKKEKEIEQEIQAAIDTLMEEASYLSDKDKDSVLRAFALAKEAHKGVFRKSGQPYIVHPTKVATTIAKELHLGPITIIAALLHDVVEDTDIPLQKLEGYFGSEIAAIVEGLTKIKDDDPWYKSKQSDNFQRLLSHAGKDIRILFVKLADRLDNMRDLHHLPRTKQLKIAFETQHVYARIAHYLGLGNIKRELEELAFKATNLEDYKIIVKGLNKRLQERKQEIEELIKPLEREFKKTDLVFRIKSRAKSIYSIYQKMMRKKIRMDEIYDLIAIRIILTTGLTEEKVACWQAYGIVTSIYPNNNARVRDWVSTPRSNGYESLHVTLMSPNGNWFEVQIRTERMHEIAERGQAAHWYYKNTEDDVRVRVIPHSAWLEDIKQLIRDGDDPEIMEQLSSLLSYSGEISVFDKQGKSIPLPKRSTLLDFAIAQKDKDGIYASYGFINDVKAPITQRLSDGDHARVVLSKEEKVTIDRDDIVIKSAKAHRVVTLFFADKDLKEMAEGKQKVQEEFEKRNVTMSFFMLERLREFAKEDFVQNVYLKVGRKKTHDIEEFFKAFFHTIVGDEKSLLENANALNGKHTYNVRNERTHLMASCCNPLPGESVIGVRGMNGKVNIHKSSCYTGGKILTKQGHSAVDIEDYTDIWTRTGIIIVVLDVGKTIQEVYNLICDYEVESLAQKSISQGRKKIILTIQVRHVDALNTLMNQLANVKGVQSTTQAPAW